MSQLAKRLAFYYTRKNNKIIFNNSLTLNGLAIAMYERLNYTKIDSSVISRVLKGERLFTVKQLQIFCEVLQLSRLEQAKLFKALQEDHLTRKGYALQRVTLSSFHDKLDIIDTLTHEAFATYYEGRCTLAKRLLMIIDDYIQQCPTNSLTPLQKHKLYELMGARLYLQGRIISFLSLEHTSIPGMISITDKLFFLGDTAKIEKLHGYAHILLSDAYYIAGGYSSTAEKRGFYAKSIEHAKKSITYFADQDRNRIAGLRNMAASSSYLGDELTFSAVKKTAEKMIDAQPMENKVYMLHFCGTIATGGAYFKHSKPLALKEKGVKHFGKTLHGKGAFEISDTRAELEALVILRSQEKKYMKSLLIKGSLLAEHEQMDRYKTYFDKIGDLI